jgi:hypothetical protein
MTDELRHVSYEDRYLCGYLCRYLCMCFQVNYKYVLADVATNNQAYIVDHVIAASDSVKNLLHPHAQHQQ